MAGRGAEQAELLKDLRKQVTALEGDLRRSSETDPEFREALNAEHQQARTAQRTAASFGQWRDERVTQIAAAWVLATVFVRFCEDNRLIEWPWIAGPGERLADAEERHEAYIREHPEKNDRDWLIAAFDHLAGTNPAVAGLFDKAHNPLWEADPSYEAASALLTFWRRRGPDGEVVYDFEDWDTRFLGDLYQDLSESARKTYALLQTPEFVEEFILDLTLEPAIEEFGLEPEWKFRPAKWHGPDGEQPTGLRTIDPACGSGHFLLGIFKRLVARWEAEAPGVDRWTLVRRALESVHGCDKNPFAVAIARFRLLLAALNAADETRLDRAPAFPINIAVGDSLIHGRGAPGVQQDLLGESDVFTYVTEDIADHKSVDLLGVNSYHVVIGNPPYITVKDSAENAMYRGRYETCAGTYALSVPFAERFFNLASVAGGERSGAGYIGQITANSFMKREFGKKLIQNFFRLSVNLTHVIDTSGTYIPGHGTPTVILVGRNMKPTAPTPVRAVLGVRGEPGQTEEPARGMVWRAIVDQIDQPGSDSEWISVADLSRDRLSVHPWSLSGGGANELLVAIETTSQKRLCDVVEDIGFGAVTREDSAYMLGEGTLRRHRVDPQFQRALVEGDVDRDWRIDQPVVSIWPYDVELFKARVDTATLTLLWPFRAALQERIAFGKTQIERGLTWFEYSMFFHKRFAPPMVIAFALVSTHNHFALDRSNLVFKDTILILRLSEEAGEDVFLGLLGTLNSSTACFWLKQVSHDKGNRGGERSTGRFAWENYFQFSASKLRPFPLPSVLPIGISRRLDGLAQECTSHEPSTVAASCPPTRARLDDAQTGWTNVRRLMIAAQEELDWQIYSSYDLLSEAETAALTATELTSVPEVKLGERAFEIVLARRVEAGEVDGEWFRRHGSMPITEIPEYWPESYKKIVQARIDIIEKRRDIALIERPECKRRWAAEPWEKKERAALRTWLLDRCEREDLWFGLRDGVRHPRTLTISQLADQFKDDADMQSVAALYATDHLGKRDLPLAKVLEEVLADEHVPYLAALRYKDSGLRKRAEWETVWEKQREEDRTGKRLDIEVPPKYASADFRKGSYWSHRGKLDVPKERFISYPGASLYSDKDMLLGWAGWDHKDQAQALVNLVNDRAEDAGWDTDRLVPLLAGLLELMPWVKQWHGEYDAEWEGVPAEEFQAFLDDRRGHHRLSEQDLRDWRPATTRRRAK